MSGLKGQLETPSMRFECVLARRSLAVGASGGLCCHTPGCPHPGDKRSAERCPHIDECAAELKWLRELAGQPSTAEGAEERGRGCFREKN